ncbi:Uncharacterized protein Adt_21218 [Abeliophyllum distichum]|uniref:Transposase MuDR plant domain-containing protein n=1 Tax=Abeliophyllum distichum TaxID=126358 RepID=A0ABD1SYU7_9LAMI
MAPMRIKNDNSVLFYMELKRKDQQLTSYPLRVEVTPLLESFLDMHVLMPSDFEDIDLQVSEGHNFVTSTSKGLPTLESFASSAYESISELVDVNSESEMNVISNPNIEAIAKDMIFRNKELLRKTMQLYAIENNFQYKVYKSDKYEYVLKCLTDSCMWRFRASKLGETDMFKIRYIRNGHSCSMDIILDDHRQSTSTLVGDCIKHKYTAAKTIYTPGDIINDMARTYGLTLSYGKAWRVREHALETIMGNLEESYGKVPMYLHMLQEKNSGTITRIKTNAEDQFVYMFMALGASIQG